MRFVWAAATHPGLVRESNQDAVYPPSSGSGPGPVLLAVADGMGGHVAGDVASRTALAAATAPDVDGPKERLVAGNLAITERIAEDPSLRGMGTTMTLARVGPDGAVEIGHVGDSRAYLYREGELRRLTVDHTVVQELVELGQISEEQADRHPQRHLLTRVLGLGPVEVDEVSLRLHPGDRLLLCSDGLTGMVEEDDIAAVLGGAADPEEAVWDLVEAANRAGGVDNVSVVVLDVEV